MTPDDLVKAAATAAVGALTKAALEPALAGGRKVWDWLKGRLTGPQAAMAAAVEQDPADSGAADAVSGLLKSLLHRDPRALEELRALLGEAGVPATMQVAIASGAGSKVAQVAGSGNAVSFGGAARAASPGGKGEGG